MSSTTCVRLAEIYQRIGGVAGLLVRVLDAAAEAERQGRDTTTHHRWILILEAEIGNLHDEANEIEAAACRERLN